MVNRNYSVDEGERAGILPYEKEFAFLPTVFLLGCKIVKAY